MKFGLLVFPTRYFLLLGILLLHANAEIKGGVRSSLSDIYHSIFDCISYLPLAPNYDSMLRDRLLFRNLLSLGEIQKF